MYFMSRKDFVFLNTLGQRYKEKGEELESFKAYYCALQNYQAASECFGKAEQIALDDGIEDNGVSKEKKEYCQKKATEMKSKDAENSGKNRGISGK